MWRFDYEHNHLQVAQLRPSVTKMVIGSINWAQGNRIMSSFYHFALIQVLLYSIRFITPASISTRKVVVDEISVDEMSVDEVHVVYRRNVRRRVVVIPAKMSHSPATPVQSKPRIPGSNPQNESVPVIKAKMCIKIHKAYGPPISKC